MLPLSHEETLAPCQRWQHLVRLGYFSFKFALDHKVQAHNHKLSRPASRWCRP